jgi:hypothetical protein
MPGPQLPAQPVGGLQIAGRTPESPGEGSGGNGTRPAWGHTAEHTAALEAECRVVHAQ